MNEIEDNTNSTSTNLEAQILAKNSFFTGLYQFAIILFSMLYSFFVARFISPEAWSILILGNAIILIITQLTKLFPPALELTYNYYIPRLFILKQEKNLKTFIRAGIIFKLLTLLPIYFICLILFEPLSLILPLELQDKTTLLYILSPLIIFESFNLILSSINLGFNRAYFLFYLYLIRVIITVGAFLYLFFSASYVSIELIAWITVIAYLIPFIINCLIIAITYYKLQNKGSDDYSFKKVSKIAIDYGSPLLLNYFQGYFWPEVQKIGIGFFSTGGVVAGFNAAISYSNISKSVMISSGGSLIVSFSRVYTTKKVQNPDYMYNLVLKYSLFIICFVSGLLFIFTDFSLKLIYTDQFLPYAIFLKLLVIAVPFQILINPFDANLSALNKTKLIAPIKLVTIIVQLLCFFILLAVFGVLASLIGLLVAEILNFLFYLILHYKVEKIRIQLKKFLFQFIIFFSTIFFVSLVESIGLSTFYRTLMINLNLSILSDFPLFSLILFIIIFFGLNFTFKIITKQDMESLEGLFGQKGFLNNLIRGTSKILKKLAFFKN